MKYELMHRKIPSAVIEINDNYGYLSKIEHIYEPDHMPVGVIDEKGRSDCSSLIEWWRDRSIPIFRPRIERLLDIFEFMTLEQFPSRCYGLSLSDQYWIRPVGTDLEWEKINFFENPFSEDAGNFLLGLKEYNEEFPLNSPDFTTNGNLEKTWKIINGKRYLLKGGYFQEPVNEVIASHLMDQMDISHVHYALTTINSKTYSLCEDFVDQRTELIPAWRILEVKKRRNEISAWQHFVDCCNELGIPGSVEFLNRMIVLDYIIANKDRHYNNFGAVRNAETLEWLGMAPIYDSGSCFYFYDDAAKNLYGGKTPSKPFKNCHEKQIELVKDFSWIDFNCLSHIREIIFEKLMPEISAGRIDEKNVKIITDTVTSRINTLQTISGN